MPVVVALVLLSGLALAGPAPVVGKWKLDSVKTKAGPVPKEKLAGGGMVWEFKPDGTAALTVWKGKESKTAAAKWTIEGTTLVVVENGQATKMTFKRAGAKLELAGQGDSTVVMTFAATR